MSKNRKQEGSPLGILVLIAIGVYFIYPYLQDTDFTPSDNSEPNNPIVQPTDTVKSEGTRLIVVAESKDRPTDIVNMLDDYEFWWEYLPSKGMDFLVLDPDDPTHKDDLVEFNARAKDRNINGPYVAHVKSTTLLKMIPIPKTTEPLKSMIEGL